MLSDDTLSLRHLPRRWSKNWDLEFANCDRFKTNYSVDTLHQLKRAGVNQADLVTIYISVLIPVVEYACPVWSTNLPVYLSDNFEMIQKRAVRAIFPGMSYDDILTQINLSPLKDRRDLPL